MRRTTPRKGSDKKELLSLRIGATAALATLIVAVFSLTSVQQFILRNPQLAAVISSVLVDLTNGDRVAQNLATLRVSPALVAAAQAKADDMARKGYFAHTSPDGIDSWYWFKQAGYSFLYAGENLAIDFSDSADIERAWLASPSHRANLMNGNYTEIGIATAVGTYQGRTTTFVVQLFGAPAKKKILPASVVEAAPKPIATPVVAQVEPVSASVLGTTTSVQNNGVIKDAAAESLAPTTTLRESIPKEAPFWGFLVTSPSTTLRYAYYLLGLCIAGTLLARTGIEIKRHHTRHVVIALLLGALMVGLFVVADRMIFVEPELIPAQQMG